MWNDLPDIITEACERLKYAQIESTDALTLIRRYNSPDTLIYCDPPYLPNLRKSHMYAHEMSGDDHVELLRILRDSTSKIIISGYDSELYNDMLFGWRTAERETTAQMGKHRLEKLWMNYDPILTEVLYD